MYSVDHNVYVWKLPPPGSSTGPESPHFVLKGHRSVVNCVRYNNDAGFLATCGVEKMVKIWSAVPLPNSTGGLDAAAASLYKSEIRSPDLLAMMRVFIRDPGSSTEEDRDMLDYVEIMLRMTGTVSDDEESDHSSGSSSTNEADVIELMNMIIGDASVSSSEEEDDSEPPDSDSFNDEESQRSTGTSSSSSSHADER